MISRRQFLLAGGATVVGLAAARALSFSDSGARRILVLGQYIDDAHHVAAIDLKSGAHVRVAVPFKPHAFVQDPTHPTRIWTFEKWGPQAALVDIGDAAMVRLFTSQDERWFFGHGTVYADTRIVLVSEVSRATYKGHLVGYDMDTHRIVMAPQVTDGWLHDVKMLPDKQVLVAHSGLGGGVALGQKTGVRLGHASLVRYDVEREMVRGHAYAKDEEQILAHFELLPEGRVMALGTNVHNRERRLEREQAEKNKTQPARLPGTDDHGQIYTGRVDDEVLTRVPMTQDVSRLFCDEMLSVVLSADKQYALVTNPLSGRVAVIATNGMYIGHADIPLLSVALDEERGVFMGAGGEGLYTLPDDMATSTGEIHARLRHKGFYHGAHSSVFTV